MVNEGWVRRLTQATTGEEPFWDEEDEELQKASGASHRESVAGAFARMIMSSLSFLFQRPVRLFRPMHCALMRVLCLRAVSTFSLVELMARREGKKLGIPYLRRLIRHERPALLLSLILPPMPIGFTLFQTYTISEFLFMRGRLHDDSFTPTYVVAVAGAAAGAAQCIISAPLDNIRLVLQPMLVQDLTKGAALPIFLRKPLQTWTAIIEAALLPFLPERWYQLIIKRFSQPTTLKEPKTQTLFKHLPKHARILSRQRHGMSLVLSLLRDAVGFSAFFITFEWARRAAYHASMAVDRWVRIVRHVGADQAVHVVARLDKSFDTSRTVYGRVTAALTLVVGGTVGALLYGLVSRPIEFVRMVLWNRLYVPLHQRSMAAYVMAARAAKEHLPMHRRLATLYPVRAVRLRIPVPRVAFAQSMRRLRVQRLRIPRKDLLTLGAAPSPALLHPTRMHQKRRVKGPPKRPFGLQTLAKLMRYARITAPAGQRHASPPWLFINTFLLRPFVSPDLCRASAPRPWGTAAPTRHKTVPQMFTMQTKPGTLRGHLAKTGLALGRTPGRVGSRLGWVLNRLMSPYGCAFLVFAWMSGDIG